MLHFISQTLVFLAAIIVLVERVEASKLTVAVASNFAPVFEELIPDFESLHKQSDVIVISGSSGKIYSQIRHGAPFDIFMSADEDKPLRLIQEGLANSDAPLIYALGKLVLWSAEPKLIIGPNTLQQSGYHKLALANSKLAPYGLAAEQVLDQLGLLKSSRSKWVQGENISQTYQFVASKNADLGFVAKAQVWKRDQLVSGSAWLIPAELYTPIKQGAVILKKTKHIDLAKHMMSFLQKPSVRRKIEMYGYDTKAITAKNNKMLGVSP